MSLHPYDSILYSLWLLTLPSVELDEIGELDRLLSYCALKYRNLKTIEEARKADELFRRQQAAELEQ